MLSSAALFAGNAVYDYKFGKKTTAVIRQFESGKPSSVIDDVLNQTLLAIAICTGIAFVFEELALHLQGIENVQAQYMVQFSLNVFILVGVQAKVSTVHLYRRDADRHGSPGVCCVPAGNVGCRQRTRHHARLYR